MRVSRKPSPTGVFVASAVLAATVVAAVVAAGAFASTSRAKGGTLTIGVLYAFTGANANNGATGMAGCLVGVTAVNAEGGVLGKKLECKSSDTKSDPADAVPATNQLLASTSNLAMVIGPSDEAPATIPIVDAAKIPNFTTVGDPREDKQTASYFYRLTPSDAVQGYGLGYYAAKFGYKKVASVFSSDLGAQTSVPTFRSRYKGLGGTIVADLTLAPGKSSYRTEVQKVIAAHPQAIVTEMDPQSSATFLSELQQLNGGKLPRIISTERSNQPDWLSAVGKAVGPAALASAFRSVAGYTELSGLGYSIYRKTLLSLKSKIRDASSYLVHPYTITDYDAVVISSLAMTQAKSSKGSDYNKFIVGVTAPKKGATIVRSLAQGVAAIKAGKKFTYVGAGGPLAFNKYHSAPRPFALWRYDPKASHMLVVKVFPGAALLPA